jgi:D-glycero-alpha-D-manno-heptose-7-phosphate kinase
MRETTSSIDPVATLGDRPVPQTGDWPIVWRTPVRVSLFGGGTDFPEFYTKYGGACLALTIGKYVTVSVRRRDDREVHVLGGKEEIVSEWNKVSDQIVRAALELSGQSSGWDIRIESDLPSEGTGLATSSSISVGLLNALAVAEGRRLTSHEVALLACRLERDLLCKPIGVQDQFQVAYGGLRFLEFKTDGSVGVSSFPNETALGHRICEHLMLFFTGKQRECSYVLQEQRANIPRKLLELRQLRQLAYYGRTCLLEGRLRELGSVLAENWILKRQLGSRVSFPILEEMYETARSYGAVGGKICGAGGGGVLLLWVPVAARASVRHALHEFRELECEFCPHGSGTVRESAAA